MTVPPASSRGQGQGGPDGAPARLATPPERASAGALATAADREFPPGGFLPAIRRWWKLIAIVTAGLVAAGVLVTARAEPTYEATTKLLVGEVTPDLSALRATAQLVETYAELAATGPFVDEAAAAVGLDVGEASASASADANVESRVLTITGASSDPDRTAAFANALADALLRSASQGGPTAEAAGSAARLRVVEPAVSAEKVWPAPALIVPLVVLVGLLGSLTLALLVEYSRDAVTSPSELRAVTRAPLLGVVERSRRPRRRAGSHGAEVHPCDLIASELKMALERHAGASLVVAGIGNERFSAELATELVKELRRRGNRAVLVDGDVEARTLSVLVGLESADGVGTLLSGGAASLDGLVVELEIRGSALGFLPCGPALEMEVNVARAREVLDLLHDRYDLVVLSAGSADGSPSAMVWSSVVDGVVLGVQEARSRRAAVTEALRRLEFAGARLIGTVYVRAGGRPLGRLPGYGRSG